jgi:hypothetical protein
MFQCMPQRHIESEGTAPLIINFATTEASGQFYTQLGIAHTKYPLNRRLGGPQSQPWHFGKEKTLLVLSGIKVQFCYW